MEGHRLQPKTRGWKARYLWWEGRGAARAADEEAIAHPPSPGRRLRISLMERRRGGSWSVVKAERPPLSFHSSWSGGEAAAAVDVEGTPSPSRRTAQRLAAFLAVDT